MARLTIPEPVQRAADAARSDAVVAKIGRGVLSGVAFVVVVQFFFNPPLNIFFFGIALGALYGLIAVGIILIYRTNRIINFAAAALGAVPGITALLLQVLHHWPYWSVWPIVIIGSALMGGLVEFVVIRRFSQSPRLIVTVATLGLVQLLAFLGIKIPIWLGSKGKLQSVIPTPWQKLVHVERHGQPLFSGDHLFALAVVFAVSLGLAAFFRYTRMGIALRASAENADRASLLGIPVRRVGTVAWVIAGVLAGLTIFLRGPLVGVPVDGSLGYSVFVYASAAAVIAKLESIPTALFAGMAVGVIEQASVVKTGSSSLATAIMLALILGALLVQRQRMSRAFDTGVSTWQSVKEFRPIPTELRGVREVVLAKSVLLMALAAVAIAAPWFVGPSRVGKLELIPIDAMVAISLVILTGWAGQISLGHFGLVGVGAAVAGGLAANHNIDFFTALVVGSLAGAAVALVLGIPALRVPGLYLAVTTLAFAAAIEGYFLRPDFWVGKHILPSGQAARVERPLLWGRIDISRSLSNPWSERRFYWMLLVFLLLVLFAARAFRRNRSGRVLIAVRDNQRAAPAYSINLARTKLAAFGISGAIAAFAGVLLAYQVGAIDYSSYGMIPSIDVFVFTVVGGLTSLGGAIAGVVILDSVKLFGNQNFSFLASGFGILIILLFLPGGFAEGFFKVRDSFLRFVANRNDILVPSLVADRRVEPEEGEKSVIEAAEQHVVEVESFDVVASGPTIACPLCGEILTMGAAAEHDHLRVPQTGDELVPAVVGGRSDPAGAPGEGEGGGLKRLRRTRIGRR